MKEVLSGCCSLDYEAEYNRAREELKKEMDAKEYLRGEREQMEKEMAWLNGFKAAVQLIFREGGFNV